MKRFTCPGLLLCLLPLAAGAQHGIVRGKVIDARTGRGLPSATVIDMKNLVGTATRETGDYLLDGLDPDTYQLEVAYLGYSRQTRQVHVVPGDTVTLDFGLLPLSHELAGVEITAPAHDLLSEPGPVTTLSPTAIARQGAVNTAQLLEDIGGVSVARAGNWGAKPYIQGMTDNRVLMFIDGIKTTQACPMGMDACTATIEPDMINSMEVEAGAGHAGYGSGNMGGVINISTVDPRFSRQERFTAEATAALRYQSVSRSRTWAAGLKGGQRKFDFGIQAGGGRHEDYRVPEPDRYTFWPQQAVVPSGFGSTWLNTHFRYRPAGGHQLAFIVQVYRADSIGWPARPGATHTIIPEEQRQLYAVRYTWQPGKKVIRRLEGSLALQPMKHDMVNYAPGGTRFVGRSATGNYQGALRISLAAGSRHALTLGAEGWAWLMDAQRKTVTDSTESIYYPIINQGQMYEGGLYLLDRYVATSWLSFDLGLRLSYIYSDAAPVAGLPATASLADRNLILSGNVTALAKINKYLSFSAGVVRGFNAATPVDRFISSPMLDGFYHFGNPALQPETSLNKRLGVRGMYNQWQWRLDLFHNGVRNMIQRVVDSTLTAPIPGLSGVKRAANMTNGSISGVSAYLSYFLNARWQVAVRTSWLRGVDQAGNNLPGMAPLEIDPSIRYENPDLGLWLVFRSALAGRQERYAAEFGEIYTPGYATFDLSGGWRLGSHVEMSLSISNLTNRYYRRHLNLAQLPEPGLNINVSVRFTLPVAGGGRSRPNLQAARLVTLRIEGMACQYCVNTVTGRTEALPRVIQTIVNLPEGRARVIVEKNVSLNELVEVIQRAGFRVQILSVEPYEAGSR